MQNQIAVGRQERSVSRLSNPSGLKNLFVAYLLHCWLNIFYMGDRFNGYSMGLT